MRANLLILLKPAIKFISVFGILRPSFGVRTKTRMAGQGDKAPKYPSTSCKDLVPYGTNLGSTVNLGFFPVSLRELIYLPSFYYSVVVGKLLSDGWLERYSSTSNTRFMFKQSIIHIDYVVHSFLILSHYCSNIPSVVKSKVKGKTYYAVTFKTRALACFNELHDSFYKNKIKVIPENIYDLLTPVALAHWIMGDGAIKNKGLTLCTDSFTTQDVVKLMNVLLIKYDIKSTIHMENKRPRIYILPESMFKLRNVVSLHILPSMRYKLNEKLIKQC